MSLVELAEEKTEYHKKWKRKKKRTKKHENTQTIIHLEIKWYRHKHPMLCIMYIKEKIEIKKLKRYVNSVFLNSCLIHLKGLSQANLDNFSAHQTITESFKISKEPVASTCRRTHRESKHEHGWAKLKRFKGLHSGRVNFKIKARCERDLNNQNVWESSDVICYWRWFCL